MHHPHTRHYYNKKTFQKALPPTTKKTQNSNHKNNHQYRLQKKRSLRIIASKKSEQTQDLNHQIKTPEYYYCATTSHSKKPSHINEDTMIISTANHKTINKNNKNQQFQKGQYYLATPPRINYYCHTNEERTEGETQQQQLRTVSEQVDRLMGHNHKQCQCWMCNRYRVCHIKSKNRNNKKELNNELNPLIRTNINSECIKYRQNCINKIKSKSQKYRKKQSELMNEQKGCNCIYYEYFKQQYDNNEKNKKRRSLMKQRIENMDKLKMNENIEQLILAIKQINNITNQIEMNNNNTCQKLLNIVIGKLLNSFQIINNQNVYLKNQITYLLQNINNNIDNIHNSIPSKLNHIYTYHKIDKLKLNSNSITQEPQHLESSQIYPPNIHKQQFQRQNILTPIHHQTQQKISNYQTFQTQYYTDDIFKKFQQAKIHNGYRKKVKNNVKSQFQTILSNRLLNHKDYVNRVNIINKRNNKVQSLSIKKKNQYQNSIEQNSVSSLQIESNPSELFRPADP